MSSTVILHKVKFITLPVRSEIHIHRFTVYELQLLERLIHYCQNKESVKHRVKVDGVLYRKASFILVRKGLAAFAKGSLYPSVRFNEEFIPLFNESKEKNLHNRFIETYEKLKSA